MKEADIYLHFLAYVRSYISALYPKHVSKQPARLQAWTCNLQILARLVEAYSLHSIKEKEPGD